MRHQAPKRPRAERTQERIVEEAERLFREVRSADVTIREICEASGASKSSFYARFPDRNALLGLLFERFEKRWRTEFDALDALWSERLRGAGAPEHANDDLSIRGYAAYAIDACLRCRRIEAGLLEAFRSIEEDDPGMRRRHQRFDLDLLGWLMRSASLHYPEYALPQIERGCEAALAVTATVLRGAGHPLGEFALEDSHDHAKIVRTLAELIVAQIEDAAR